MTVVLEGIDTIDSSDVDDSILAHSYSIESIPVIRDIAQMLRRHLPADDRATLRPVCGEDGVHWLLQGELAETRKARTGRAFGRTWRRR